MSDVMATMIQTVLAPILPYAAGSIFGLAALFYLYHKIRDLF